MSGIVGIVNLDGSPVDRGLLEALVATQHVRGPDGEGVWTGGNVGLGHTLLRTTPESEREQQPASLDEQTWITADARVDGRDELIRKLNADDRIGARHLDKLETAGDEFLVLCAYETWGARCTEHLLGDFAFAIWDSRRRQLFCARDQLGVAPFFYAITDRHLVFASELGCVRRHPGLSNELDDLWIADFLMFSQSQNFDSTAFAAVRRLPPGRRLTWNGGSPKVRRYWTLEVPAELRYPSASDYVERLQELLHCAVGDRLRTRSAAVLMSGGIDSPLLTAIAKDELSRQVGSADLHAHTVSFDEVFPDEEPAFAQIAALALDVPLEVHSGTADPLFASWGIPGWTAPEPSSEPFEKLSIDLMGAISQRTRVALTGFDGDLISMVSLSAHLRQLLMSRHWRRAGSDAWLLIARHRMLPPTGIRTWLRTRRRSRDVAMGPPPWIGRELASRYDLASRWRRFQMPDRPGRRSARAEAIAMLNDPLLPMLFESHDPAWTGHPLAVRHPLFDLRIVDFMLSMPPIPWLVDKAILRRLASMRLPESISSRPKAPLAGDPGSALLARSPSVASQRPRRSATLNRFISVSDCPPPGAVADSPLLWPVLRTLALDHWLATLDDV